MIVALSIVKRQQANKNKTIMPANVKPTANKV